ncbi:MAG: hypothetical protein K6253_03155, partial [Candidatus Liberibacter asiaticus]|nr:hypothetical protein [Candidatus Liberibacter asiaticus]
MRKKNTKTHLIKSSVFLFHFLLSYNKEKVTNEMVFKNFFFLGFKNNKKCVKIELNFELENGINYQTILILKAFKFKNWNLKTKLV